MSKRLNRILWFLGALASLCLLVSLIAFALLRSDWFHEQVRARMVREIEKATGGKTEMGSFKFDWSTMQAQVRDFTLHGKEKPGEPPFLRVQAVTVGLKIVSMLKKEVDIATGIVEKPEFHLIVYPDGTTNLPSPEVRRKGNFIDTVLKLKIRHYEIRNGIVEFKEERVPLDIRGDNLAVSLDYDVARQAYNGHLASRQLHVETVKILPLVANLDTDIAFDRQGIRFPNLVMTWPRSKVELSGGLSDWSAPKGAFDIRASVHFDELGDVLRIPLERRGQANFTGTVEVNFTPRFTYNIHGKAGGRNLAISVNGIAVSGATFDADASVTPEGVRLSRFRTTALGGTFEGRASLPDFKRFEVEGEAAGLSIDQLSRFGTSKRLPWSGLVSGPARLSGDFAPKGVRNLVASGNLIVSQASGGIPVEGVVEVTYDQRAGTVALGNSRISTPHSRLIVSGTLGSMLSVSARTSNLDDILPALQLISPNAPKEIPLKLGADGSAAAEATVAGPLNNPKISGKLTAQNLVAANQRIDELRSDFDVDSTLLSARNLDARQGVMHVGGQGRLALANWRAQDESRIAAALQVRGADVRSLLKQAASDLDVSGTAAATVDMQGTFGRPTASIKLTVDKPAGYGEQFDRITADLRYTGGGIEIISGNTALADSTITFTGAYSHPESDWANGSLRFNIASQSFKLERIKRLQSYGKAISGDLTLKTAGSAQILKSNFDLKQLDSEAAIRGLTLDGSRLGNATVTARTRDRLLDVKLEGNLRNSRINGSGQWKLEGDYPGRGELQFTPISFGTLQRVATAAGETRSELPFQGRMEGRAVVTGPLKNPDALRAEVTLSRFEISPAANQRLRVGGGDELVLRNVEPVSFIATTKDVLINSARLTAKDTNIEARGRVAFNVKSPWDVQVNGGLNLAVLQLFNSDLLATGNAVIAATVTGALNDPQVTGRMELKGASLYLGDVTTGVDNANGLISFDRNRATIQSLTAEVGGGRVGFGGFIGFSGGLLLYRVQANADQVRIRYPEGVSTTVNAQLDLTGTSANSLISGTVTVMRAGFTPKADLGALLAQSAKPVTTPTAPNEYLRNIQLDVRVESGPSLQFQTSLTRDLQAEADLRLRGNVARPSLIGTVSVNEGEVNVFGTKYAINRGEIRFLNPTRIEPVFDIDLETKARGITVNISFTGSLNKLNLTYRSDPPLQTSEIIALIAVGRDPTTSAALASGQMTQNSFLETGSSALGQAIAAPVTSRLQRFFGVSRLKIDPQLTGVENIPQARLTLEQQVSRDITLTYITNLTRTQEQIVRIQWDINKQWSAIAVREENGVFGVDFQYRKRFK